ncbi:MAG: HAMP domain-containing sensor histidine kinase [Armatimonas sp.]
MLRPVQAATREAASIGAEELARRLPVEGDDEFAELTTTLNGMLARLEASFEQQQRFTADASHELRTPLTVVKSASSRVLSRTDLPDDIRRAMERINRASGVMGDVIEDLLLLARSDSNQLDLQPGPILLHDFLDDLIADIPMEGSARVENKTPQGQDQLTLYGDPRHLSRLFTNLIENAMRHTPTSGAITLDASSQNGSTVIYIKDTGEGIAPEHLPHVLERFYRADAARTRASGGTGLGLSICQTIAEAHGGTLKVQSVLGQGTTVSVTLPLSDTV